MEITTTGTTNLVPLSTTLYPVIVNLGCGEDVELEGAPQPLYGHQRLNQDAHRRWKVNTSVEFLTKVHHIDILETRTNKDQTVLYVLEVYRRKDATSAAFVVERSFSGFEKLREGVQNAVNLLPPCTCQYCLDFLVYVRFNMAQPRGIVKLTAGTEKRKKILSQFINDLLTMGRRRVEKVGKRECEAQLLIPVLLEEFLLGASESS